MQDFGGAGGAAYRLHRGLLSIGVNSTMLVLNKKSEDPSVKVIPDAYSGPMTSCIDTPRHDSLTWQKHAQRWGMLLAHYPKRPDGLEVFRDADSDVRLDLIKEVQEADIINLHWVNGVFDCKRAPSSMAGKPIVWTIHDMNPFTGGCHYAGDCDRYKMSCGKCPQLGSEKEHDLSNIVWKKRNDAYPLLNVHIVSPSKWLAKCASESNLFSRFPVSVIPNGFPIDKFKPYPQKEAREFFGIEMSTNVILFGADSVVNKRKGFVYLLKALNNIICSEKQNILLITFGHIPDNIMINIQYPVKNFGHVSEKQLSIIYSMADLFVITSLEDNLPNTVLESMACGTPVVGFNIGGIPDMIEHKETGYLAKSKNVDDLAKGISWILSSSEETKSKLSKQCRKKAEELYALEIQANNYRRLYEELYEKQQSTLKETTELNEQAKQALQNGDVQSAKELLTKVLSQSPNNTKALNNLAVTKILEKDWKSAQETLQKVLQLDPSNQIALENQEYLHQKISETLTNEKKVISDTKKDGYLVSAVVSVYNSEEFIQGCLQTLVEQTIYEKGLLEIIVVDTGSEHDEMSVVESYQQRYSHIKYIRTEERETIYKAWNRGAQAAFGKYIVNTNTDDRLRRDALERMADVLECREDVGIVYIDQILTEHPNETFNRHHKDGFLRRPDFSMEVIVQRNPCGPQVMWRKCLHELVGYFNPAYEVAGDWDFWLRVVFNTEYTIYHIPELLGLYYYNKKGLEHGGRKQLERQREIAEIKKTYPYPPGQCAPVKYPAYTDTRRNGHFQTGKRILLATSAAPSQSPFSTIEKRPPIGLGFLISVLRNAGHEVFFIDNYLQPNNFLETDYLQRNKIDYVGIYANTICYRDTLRMFYKLDYLRRTGRWRGKIMVGGPHTTVALHTIPDFVDYIIQGEGERAILDIVEDKVKDRVVRYPTIKNLDELPMPAWDYFIRQPYKWGVEWFRETPVFTLNTSRGCPFKCTFCSVMSIWGKQYTYFSAERIVSDIEYLIKNYGAKGFYFREDNFTLNKKRLTTFCNLLIEKKINIPWACETRVNTIDREIVELMHSAGARAFYFGVESGSQKILDFFKKDITIEQTRDAFRLCHEFGIKTAASVIVGVPPETEDDIVQTIRLVEEIKPTVTWYNVFVGIPDSELYKYVKKNKLYEFADDRGLLYLKGHNERVRRFYGNQWNAYVPIDINNPKISVVMSVYNGGKYLEDSVKSILTQTYQDFEFIIVNDASTDDSLEIIKKIEDCRLRIITNPENIGLTKSLNKGIQLARGEYIARMDVDDISLPHRFETQVNFLEKNPDYALVGSSYYQIDKDNKTNALINVLTDNAQIKQGMTKQNWFGHGSVMMRKYVFLQVGGYDERFQLAQDYDLWLRIAECYKVANIAEPLYKWRTTKSGISVEKEAEQKHYASLAISEAKKRNHPKIARNGTQHPSNTLQTNPLVSVIVPTYNRPDTLKTTLDSIAAQTYKNIETIVVNDAGGDVSGVIDTFHDRLSVRYLVHHKNKGLGASRNTGINAATGKYIAYLDDDDIYYPDHIETLVCFLETSYYKVAYTDAYRTHQKKENGKYIVKKKDIPYSFDFDSDLILAQNLMPVLCIMHERSCTDEVGLFDESLTTHEDWDLWVRMSRKYKFAHIKRVTCEFAWKTDSTTMSSEKRSDFLRTMVIIYKRYWEFSKDKQRVLELQRECTRCLQLELKQTVNSCYPRVSFIIPVFNKIEFIRKCLDAIVKNTLKESFEVIIIDNASTDSTKDFLKCLEGDVKIVTNDKNLGFARACNQGARMASSDYLLFLNNDTEPQKGWLGPLLEVLIRDNSVAAAGSKLLFSNETIQHAGVVIADNKNVNDPLLATHIYAKEPANLPEANQLRTYQALTAACLLIRKSVFNEVGGFDEGYWNGYEDVDLCFKLQERGWKLVYQPESVVIHHESKSGQERFIKVNENIKRLHDKWQGKIKPDIIIKEDGSTIVTENNKIKQYSLPNELPTEAANIKSQKLVSIIMLTWNALEYTQKCIRSIQDYTHYPYEVVFVDNGSSDGTVEYLRKIVKEHPNYKLIDNQENKGFAAGNNQGVKLASGKYIMLLNNDVLVSEGWLENLVESLERDEKIGMVGPITNSISGRQQVKDVPYADEMLKLQKGTKYKGDIHRNENNSSFFSASYVVEDGFFDEKGFHRFAQSIRRNFKGRLTPRYRIAGFAIFMKKSLYEEVGGLDESFGTGNYEDDDLCLKVRDKGYAVMVDESVFIHHYRSQTFKENKIDYKNSIITNDTKFKEKWPEVDYTELLELHTKLVDTNAMLIKQGQQALNTGYTRKAFDFYSSVLKTNPIDESAIYGIGLVHQMEGNIEKAIDSYNKALKINPAFYEAYYNLGILYSKTSNINNAITALSKAIEVNNNDASVYNNLGVLYFKKKVFREARACFENALAIDPDYQEAKQNLEKVLENVGNTTQPGIGQE